MYFNISASLTPQNTSIISHHMKNIIKRKREKNKNMGGQTKPMNKKYKTKVEIYELILNFVKSLPYFTFLLELVKKFS